MLYSTAKCQERQEKVMFEQLKIVKTQEAYNKENSLNATQRQRQITINKKEPIALWYG